MKTGAFFFLFVSSFFLGAQGKAGKGGGGVGGIAGIGQQKLSSLFCFVLSCPARRRDGVFFFLSSVGGSKRGVLNVRGYVFCATAAVCVSVCFLFYFFVCDCSLGPTKKKKNSRKRPLPPF